jgi:predicted Zn-dependent protease
LALASLKEYAKAKDVLKTATEKFPGFPELWESLSGAYAQLGMAKEAKEAFGKFQKLSGKPATQK